MYIDFLKGLKFPEETNIQNKIKSLFSKQIDESAYEDLEELFYEADLGSAASLELVEEIKSKLRKDPSLSTENILSHIRSYLLNLLKEPEEFVAFIKLNIIKPARTIKNNDTTSIR